MKVGIDLSSTNTGLVILSDDNKLIFHGNFQLWDKSNSKPYRVLVSEFFDIIECKLINKSERIIIGVELSDFGNWKYADRFNFIAGALFQEHYHRMWGSLDDFVCFNSNEWQQHLGLKPSMERQFRKDTARQFTKSNCLEYTENWTEDECDAYCIAYFLEKLRDRTQMHQEVKVRNKTKAKSEKQALRDKYSKEHKISKLKDIVIKYKSMEKLTKAQQRALEKAEMELKEYEKEK